MIRIPSRILLARHPIDFRKSINGLAAVVELTLLEAPLSDQVFVFTNKRRDALKLLFWDCGGFVLVYKRLERGRFRLPEMSGDRYVATPAELAAILEGIDLSRARRLPRWNPTKVLDGGHG